MVLLYYTLNDTLVLQILNLGEDIMVKYIIFDFDGTLVDSIDLLVAITKDIADKHKMNKLNNKEINELKILSVKQRMERLNVPFYKLPLVTIDILTKYKQNAKQLKISSDIKNLLIQLKKLDLKLIVLSSNSAENIKKCLKANGIECIDKIYSTRGLLDKSSVIKKFIKENSLGKNKEEILYVGDERRDIDACKKQG